MKKILISLFIFFGIISNSYADNVIYNYPKLGEVIGNYGTGVTTDNYINSDIDSLNEFCFSKGYTYSEHSTGIKANGKNAEYNDSLSIWQLSSDTNNFTKRVICDDGYVFSNTGSVLNKTIISGGQTIKLEGELKSNNNDFMTQAELFNFYQLELTILLFITIIVSIRKISVHRKNDEFKF